MKFQKTLLALALVCSPVAFAATQGDLDSTSSEGSTDVSITIDPLVQVTVQGDIALGSATAGTDATQGTGICIYRNGDADVDVTLTSEWADAGAFRMVHSVDGTEFLGYSVDLSGTAFDSGSANTISDENNSSSSCGGAWSHTLNVTVLGTDIDAATAGAYADTVTILVAPAI